MYIVITGTSQGIGLELVKVALSNGHHVLAVARKPEDSELMKLKSSSQKLEILKLDINEPDAEKRIAQAVKNWPSVDVLVNNAGVYEEDSSVEKFEKSFLTNSIKPFFITKYLLEKLKLSARPLSLQISSQMASIDDNKSGGSYSYRASKAALNMIFKSLSVDEPWLISVLVHPGWVKTRMGGSEAPVEAQQSVAGIWKLINDANQSFNGKFLDYTGRNLPW